jgi:hypothetical protein
MGTRSAIGIQVGKKIKAVYCHWDGYPSYNGRILFENYDTAKTKELVANGDLSSLGADIGKKHPFSEPQGEMFCTFYGRDRGEHNTEARTSGSEKEFLEHYDDSEYYYLMKDGVWYIADSITNKFKKLTPKMCGIKTSK